MLRFHVLMLNGDGTYTRHSAYARLDDAVGAAKYTHRLRGVRTIVRTLDGRILFRFD